MKTIAKFFHYTSIIFQAILILPLICCGLAAAIDNDVLMGYAFFAFFIGILQMIDALIRSFAFYKVSRYFISHFIFGLLYSVAVMQGMNYILDGKHFAEFIRVGFIVIFFVIIPTIAAIIYFVNSENSVKDLEKVNSEFV